MTSSAGGGEAPGRASTAALVTGLSNEDWRVRQSAARKLADLGPEVISTIVEALSSTDARTLSAAAWALGFMGEQAEDAVPDLVRALRGSGNSGAKWALTKIGAVAVPALTIELGSDAPQVRASAAEVLGSFGGEAASAIQALIERLMDRDKGVRGITAWALGQAGPDAVPALIEALSRRPPLRDGELQGWRAEPLEYRWLHDGTAEALTRLGAPAAASLASLVEAEDWYTSRRAVQALAKMGPAAADAVPVLRELLVIDDVRVRTRAREVLEAIGALEVRPAQEGDQGR